MRLIGFLSTLLLIFPVLAYSYISVSEARQMAEKGEAVIIDVRQQQYYEEGHIPGALLMPLDNLEKLVRSGRAPIMTSDMLILYCDCPAEESSLMAASILAHYGFSKIYVMKGGWQAWKDAGFPIIAGTEPGSLVKKIKTPIPTSSATTIPPSLAASPQPIKDYKPFFLAGFLIVGICAVVLVLIYATLKRR
jgi:rhodanese-related sulfurtransferase